MNSIAVMMIAIGAQRYQYNEKIQDLLPVCGASGNVRNAYTKTLAKRSGTINKQFRVAYEIKGTRIIDVFIKDADLPSDWLRLKPEEQDEWLYSRQEYSVIQHEDIDYGKAVSVLEVRHLGVVR